MCVAWRRANIEWRRRRDAHTPSKSNIYIHITPKKRPFPIPSPTPKSPPMESLKRRRSGDSETTLDSIALQFEDIVLGETDEPFAKRIRQGTTPCPPEPFKYTFGDDKCHSKSSKQYESAYTSSCSDVINEETVFRHEEYQLSAYRIISNIDTKNSPNGPLYVGYVVTGGWRLEQSHVYLKSQSQKAQELLKLLDFVEPKNDARVVSNFYKRKVQKIGVEARMFDTVHRHALEMRNWKTEWNIQWNQVCRTWQWNRQDKKFTYKGPVGVVLSNWDPVPPTFLHSKMEMPSSPFRRLWRITAYELDRCRRVKFDIPITSFFRVIPRETMACLITLHSYGMSWCRVPTVVRRKVPMSTLFQNVGGEQIQGYVDLVVHDGDIDALYKTELQWHQLKEPNKDCRRESSKIWQLSISDDFLRDNILDWIDEAEGCAQEWDAWYRLSTFFRRVDSDSWQDEWKGTLNVDLLYKYAKDGFVRYGDDTMVCVGCGFGVNGIRADDLRHVNGCIFIKPPVSHFIRYCREDDTP